MQPFTGALSSCHGQSPTPAARRLRGSRHSRHGAWSAREKRERHEQITDQVIHTTSRYMLGNLAISVICTVVYGVTAASRVSLWPSASGAPGVARNMWSSIPKITAAITPPMMVSVGL
jgi:hypothetical protein